MKTNNISKLALALTIGLTSTVTTAIADHHKSDGKSMQKSQMTGSDISRVTEEQVEGLTTAKDLIGASLFDRNGDKIGDIVDVSFGRDVVSSASMGQWSDKKSSMSKEKMDGEKKKDWDKDSYNSANKSKDKMESGDRMASNQMSSQRPESIVFVSVGGLWGIGDDLVRIPASQLSFDSSEERFVLSTHSAEDVIAVAERNDYEFDEDDYYTDTWYDVNMYGVRSNWDYDGMDDSTTRAKREYDNDKDIIMDAFESDSDYSDQFAALIVSHKDGKIYLTGTVNSREAKKQAEKLAKEQTSLEVENDIKVER